MNFVNVNKSLTSDLNIDVPGYVIVENLLYPATVLDLKSVLATLKLKSCQGGIRRIEQLAPQVKQLANSPEILALAQKFLGHHPKLVRAIYFDKSKENNWYVTWHQDKTVAVSERFDIQGWEPWSLKAGVWHVQPPLDVLEQMLTIRIHLDTADKSNGCLKVIPGSHRFGLLPSGEITKHIQDKPVVYCEVPEGGAVIMKPHILHASEKAYVSIPRRVLHFEYTNAQLPAGFSWSN